MEEKLPVPMIGLSFDPTRAFDPRQKELLALAARAGLEVLAHDALYVYVAGFTASVGDALRRQRPSCRILLTLQEEWAPRRS